MTDREKLVIALRALKYADWVLFDTYSNAQKLSWQEIEENCREGCNATNEALNKIGYSSEEIQRM